MFALAPVERQVGATPAFVMRSGQFGLARLVHLAAAADAMGGGVDVTCPCPAPGRFPVTFEIVVPAPNQRPGGDRRGHGGGLLGGCLQHRALPQHHGQALTRGGQVLAQPGQRGLQLAAPSPMRGTQAVQPVQLALQAALALDQPADLLAAAGHLLAGLLQPAGGLLGGLDLARLLGQVGSFLLQRLLGRTAAITGVVAHVLLGGLHGGGRRSDALAQRVLAGSQLAVGEQADPVRAPGQRQQNAGPADGRRCLTLGVDQLLSGPTQAFAISHLSCVLTGDRLGSVVTRRLARSPLRVAA